MDRPTSTQLNPIPNGLSNFKGNPSAGSGATGQAFSRTVTEVGQTVTNHDITDQSTSSDNHGYLNPKKKWLKDFIVQNTTSDKRERQRKLRKDPAYAERQRELKRERQRERYQTGSAFAEGLKIYNKTYIRIKRQTSNKEEAKEQAVIARNQYLQSANSAKNSCDLPLTSNLAETTRSSSKNLDGTAPPLFSRLAEGIFTVPIEPISP